MNPRSTILGYYPISLLPKGIIPETISRETVEAALKEAGLLMAAKKISPAMHVLAERALYELLDDLDADEQLLGCALTLRGVGRAPGADD